MPTAVRAEFALLDWLVLGSYLLFALGIGLGVRGKAAESRESFFLAGRSLPWWWAGLSIAATTFAADTPLAITGIVARRGISGNWLWMAIVAVHAGVVVYLASCWSRSGVLTDAELTRLRYSGRAARWLRWLRAGLSGVVVNGVILGWVLRAMSKIVSPFFHWDLWTPGLVSLVERVLGETSPLGTASDALSILVLLFVVAFYSSLGGLRGVVVTDLVQLTVALGGSTWLAVSTWQRVGGQVGLADGLAKLGGPDHHYLDLFPTVGSGWLGEVQVGAAVFALYLFFQAHASPGADGGGYMMQRMNATPDPKQARGAALVFLAVHYLIRIWPWFVVGLGALVLIPPGAETSLLGPIAAPVAADRELAYPVLMGVLLPAGGLGLMVTSLLAAFMSTVDTHLNWGASYVVNDIYLVLRPEATPQEQVRVARLAVLGFVGVAVLMSTQIQDLSEAWRWQAGLGAALGTTTLLRWVWWRVSAAAEIAAMVSGLTAFVLLGHGEGALPFEKRLILVALSSLGGMLLGVLFGPRTDPETIATFVERVQPVGFWPGRTFSEALRGLGERALRAGAVLGGALSMITGVHRWLFLGLPSLGVLFLLLGAAAVAWGALADPALRERDAA